MMSCSSSSTTRGESCCGGWAKTIEAVKYEDKDALKPILRTFERVTNGYFVVDYKTLGKDNLMNIQRLKLEGWVSVKGQTLTDT